jgi:hypothetical protein
LNANAVLQKSVFESEPNQSQQDTNKSSNSVDQNGISSAKQKESSVNQNPDTTAKHVSSSRPTFDKRGIKKIRDIISGNVPKSTIENDSNNQSQSDTVESQQVNKQGQSNVQPSNESEILDQIKNNQAIPVKIKKDQDQSQKVNDQENEPPNSNSQPFVVNEKTKKQSSNSRNQRNDKVISKLPFYKKPKKTTVQNDNDVPLFSTIFLSSDFTSKSDTTPSNSNSDVDIAVFASDAGTSNSPSNSDNGPVTLASHAGPSNSNIDAGTAVTPSLKFPLFKDL